MEREHIIKALENCQKMKCRSCTYDVFGNPLSNCRVKKHALSLIKELTEENERLINNLVQQSAENVMLIGENKNLHASCTELTRNLECANLEIECKERILESYMLQYGTVADKEVWLRKERADTVRKMQSEIEARCIKGGIYPAFVKSTIDQIAKELIGE